MERIQSAHNQYIKVVKQLSHKKDRDAKGMFLLEGDRLIQEAISVDYPLEFALATEDGDPVLLEKLDKICPVYLVPPKLFHGISETENPQGIISVGRQKRWELSHLEDSPEASFLMVVDGVQDPGNLGTIIRTAAAAGVDGIIVTKLSADVFNSKTVRATMGSLFFVPVVSGETPENACRWLKENCFKMVVGHVNGHQPYTEAEYRGKLAVVVGNENRGPSSVFIDNGYTVRIPCLTESLNVSVAAAILLYERVRVRLQQKS